MLSETNEAVVKQVVPVEDWLLNGENKLRVSINLKENVIEFVQSARLTVTLILRIQKGDEQRSISLTTFDLDIANEQFERIQQDELTLKLKNKDLLMTSKSSQNKEINLGSLFIGAIKGVIKTNKWSKTDSEAWTYFDQKITLDII